MSTAATATAQPEWPAWTAPAQRFEPMPGPESISGALAWPYVYPWPQRPAGLVDHMGQSLVGGGHGAGRGQRGRHGPGRMRGLGIDLCEVGRIERELKRGDADQAVILAHFQAADA